MSLSNSRSCNFRADKNPAATSSRPSSATMGVVRKIEAVERRKRQSRSLEAKAKNRTSQDTCPSINNDPVMIESGGPPQQAGTVTAQPPHPAEDKPSTAKPTRPADSASGDGLSDKEKLDIATLLTKPERLWTDYFSGIMDYPAQAVGENLDEGMLNFNNSAEVTQARLRGEERLTSVCWFPLKLILTPLKRGRGVVNAFASMLDAQFGPLHVTLQVGDVELEWDDSSLVSPFYCDYEDRVMELGVQRHSKWLDFTGQHRSRMRRAARDLDFPEQIELTYTVASEKKKLIDNLIDVIVRYNKYYSYNLLSRNCQHFVCDALKALEVDLPKEFTGGAGGILRGSG